MVKWSQLELEEPGEPPRGKSWTFGEFAREQPITTQRCPLVAVLLNSQHFYFRSDGYLKIVYLTTVHTNIQAGILT